MVQTWTCLPARWAASTNLRSTTVIRLWTTGTCRAAALVGRGSPTRLASQKRRVSCCPVDVSTLPPESLRSSASQASEYEPTMTRSHRSHFSTRASRGDASPPSLSSRVNRAPGSPVTTSSRVGMVIPRPR